MTVREWIFAALLAVAGSLITYGAALAWEPAGFIVGGVLLALWSWSLLAGPDAPSIAATDDEVNL